MKNIDVIGKFAYVLLYPKDIEQRSKSEYTDFYLILQVLNPWKHLSSQGTNGLHTKRFVSAFGTYFAFAQKHIYNRRPIIQNSDDEYSRYIERKSVPLV